MKTGRSYFCLRCKPAARGEIMHWQLVDFSHQKSSQVIINILTSVIAIFFNIVSCFVET